MCQVRKKHPCTFSYYLMPFPPPSDFGILTSLILLKTTQVTSPVSVRTGSPTCLESTEQFLLLWGIGTWLACRNLQLSASQACHRHHIKTSSFVFIMGAGHVQSPARATQTHALCCMEPRGSGNTSGTNTAAGVNLPSRQDQICYCDHGIAVGYRI